ncbi:MAG: reverse transcriptase family protein, partial [Candidatus Thiodiazotropha sp.]
HKIRCKPLPPIGLRSDHDVVLYDTSLQAVRAKPVKRKIYLWKQADTANIRTTLSNYSNSFQADAFDCVEDMWQSFKTALISTMEKFVPSKMSSSRHTHPWVNTQIRRATRRKQRAHKKAKASRKKRDWDRFKSLQSSTQKEIRAAHKKYMEDVVSSDLKQNPKNFWSFIKSKRQDSTGVSPLIDKDGFLHSDGAKKAEILNSQFHSAYTREDTSQLPNKGTSPFPPMEQIQVHQDGVLKLLKNLKPHKASGPDNLPTRILILAAEELAPVLTTLFQLSLDKGELPKEWKDALISPIYKKGDRNTASNYRPVSLTCVICKILEHIVHSSVMKHFDKHQILTDKQHGFRRRRSCESQLITTIEGIASKLRSGRDQVDIILLDFSKAFDKVPHQRLLHKLEYYGVRGGTLSWIKEFLSGRSQQVILEGQKSSQKEVLSGVPQGTVLGPLLFLAFINDLPEVVKTSEARLFADDCLLYRHIRHENDSSDLQTDLSALEDWETKWQMHFHPEKCTVIRVCTSTRLRKNTSYRLHGHVLDTVDCSKYLGVNISEDLAWKKHVDNTAAKASRTLGFLRRNLRDCRKEVRSAAYSAMVQPTLDYAATSWDPYNKDDINTLEKVQRRGARFVCNNYTDRSPGCVTAMLGSLNWIPLTTRRYNQRLTMLFKLQHGLVDIGDCAVLRPGDQRTRGAYRLYQPPATLSVYKYSFFPRTISDWNRLPTRVTDCHTLEEFKAALMPAASSSTPAY